MKTSLLARSRSCLLALAALLTATPPMLTAQTTPTADDYGNTPATAATVTLPSTKSGSLEAAGDTDWFKFTLNAPAVITAVSGGTTDVVGHLILGGAKGAVTEIYADNDGAGSPNFRLSQLMPAGTHYVYIHSAVYGTTGSYTVNFTAAAPTTAQPDITLGMGGADLPAGTLVDYGTTTPGTMVTKEFVIGNAGNADLRVYSVRTNFTGTLPAGSTIPFRITTSPGPTVLAGRQTTFRVAFQAGVAGIYNGKVTVVSSDGDEIFYEFPVRGTATGAVLAPEIAVRDGSTEVATGGTIAVGSTTVNARITKTITIANTGAAELKISSFTLVPVSTATGGSTTTTVPMAFSIYNSTIPTAVPAGGQASFQIALLNPVAGSYSARLTLNNNDANENPTIINLTGTVAPDPVAGEIAVATGGSDLANNSTVAYGNNVTGAAITKDFVISNPGTAELKITSWQLSIPAPPVVSVATSTVTGSTSATVASAANLTVGTAVSGPFPSGTVITAISGTTLTLSTAATSTITNTYLAYYTGGPSTMVNAFRVDSSVPTTLAPGASATVKITYLPLQSGDHAASFKAFNNDSDENPFTINLTGHADVNPNPGDIAVSLDGIDVTANSDVDWGSVPVGTTSLKTFTITNNGSGELRLTGYQASPVQPLLSSTTPLYFYFGGTPSNVLAAGQSGSLIMVFKPSVAGTAYKATLIISSTDPDENPYRFNLLGTGTSNTNPVPDIEINVNGAAMPINGTFAFGPVNAGTLLQKSLLINNTGAAPLTITGLAITQPVGTPAGTPNPFGLYGTPPITIASGTAYSTWLNFAPTIAGDYTAAVQILSNDSDESPYTIGLTGTGVGTVAAPELGLSLGGVDVPLNASVPYGEIATGTTLSKQFTVSNSGDAPLTLSGWTFLYPSGSTTAVSTTTTLGSNVATVLSTNGIVPGMSVNSPFPNGTTVVSVSGTSVTFSNAAGSSVSNSYITYFQPGVPNISPFRYESMVSTTVAPGASTNFTITYAPTAPGAHSMIARFSNNDISENPYQFVVSGSATGTAAVPEVGISVAGVDQAVNSTVAYGSTTVGTPVSKQFVISNTGTAPLTISGMSFSLAATSVNTTGSAAIGSTSTTVGSTSGLSVGMVLGSGTPFPTGSTIAAISGNTLTISTAAIATSPNSLLSFYPAGTATTNYFQISGTTPTSIAAGASATVTVNYTPTAAGNHSILFRFNNNDSNENPFQLMLTGSATGTVPAPEIAVTLDGTDVPLNGSIAYGSTAAGTTVTKQLVIANTGAAVLNLSGYGFYLTASGAAVPTTTTLGSTTATVTSSTGITPGMVVVGPFPAGTTVLVVNGNTITFSSPATSSVAASSLTYYPAGTSTLNPFRVDGTAPATVAAGATATLSVTYAPTAAGNHSMLLRFNNNDSNENPYQITLSGTALATTASPEISVFIGTVEQARNSTLDFGTIARGTTATKDFIIKNTGTANLTTGQVITALTPSGSLNTFTWQLISGGTTIAPAGSATVRVTFKPTALSTSYSAAYNITNNDTDENPYGFTLTGASLDTDSEISVTSSGADLPNNGTLAFGSTALGTTVTKTYTVTNIGAANLAISSWGTTPASGSFPTTTIPPFTISGITSSLAPGASTTITVTYRPVLVSTADIWVITMTNSDADEGTYKINLTGSAVPSATPSEVGVSVAGVDIASGGTLAFSTAVNTALTKDIIISNTGTDPLLIGAYWTVNSAPAGSIAFTTLQAPPASIPAGGTGVWRVKFLPTAAGSAFAAKLTLHNTDPDEGAYVINLTGATTP